MLRFFSSIRKGLINEGKTSRYVRYAVGEILLIIVGILIALQINNWNEERLLRVEEREAITMLLSELRQDVEGLDMRLQRLNRKEASLLRVRNAFLSETVSEPISFLRDVVVGASYGWNQQGPNRSTFDDLIGAGRLGIIGRPDIRIQISNYYKISEGEIHRMDARETEYPHLSYQLILRDSVMPGGGTALEFDVESSQTEYELETIKDDEETAKLIRQIINSPLKDHLKAELNFGRFAHRSTLLVQAQAQDLISMLEDYQREIEN